MRQLAANGFATTREEAQKLARVTARRALRRARAALMDAYTVTELAAHADIGVETLGEIGSAVDSADNALATLEG